MHIWYDRWLEEGDLKMLMYITKIQKYLSRGRAHQEHNNLAAQIDALLDIKYTGNYRYLIPDGQPAERIERTERAELLITIMRPDPAPDMTYLNDVEEFLRNLRGIKIKLQATEQLGTHPMWLLWATLTTAPVPSTSSVHYQTALWYYLQVFIMYMELEEFAKAARVYDHASRIKIRDQPLPVLCPYVIQQVMKVSKS